MAQQYINTNKEFFWGDWYFKSHVMAEDFDYKAHKKELSPYYESRGFKVSMMFDDYFSRLNGIHSDRYLSMDVYYFFVIPALNRYDFKDAYLDKNIYSELFPQVKQPRAIVKNMHGLYYIDGEQVTMEQAVDAVVDASGELMIKPTVETCNGEGVEQIRDFGADAIRELFRQYAFNFIVQEKVKQHPALSQVNHLYPYAHLRFGGKGAIKDNVSQGGGTCVIDHDGVVDDRVFRFKNMNVSSLKQETGVEHLVIPNYQRVIDTLIAMHKRLPYFDYVGWDVTVDPDGEPLFIEFNLVPAIEGPQLMAGPMFAEHLDEVVERARQGQCSKVQTNKKVYPKGSVFYLHAR